jgi:H+/Cl- antiporter ClcA
LRNSAVTVASALTFVKLRVALVGLRQRAWLAGLAGAAATIVVALFVPTLLFSGQSEVPGVITDAAGIGALALVALGIGKLVFSGWSLSTAYFGGPIFPLIFAGVCFGLALNLFVPAIPQGVAVVSLLTGMVTAAAVAPLSVTVFIALLAQPELAPAVAISAVASYIVRQAIAPTLPGVYRATQAAEADTAAK